MKRKSWWHRWRNEPDVLWLGGDTLPAVRRVKNEGENRVENRMGNSPELFDLADGDADANGVPKKRSLLTNRWRLQLVDV